MPLLGLSCQRERADVTFTRDVAPILFEHCLSCHRPGESAPFSLASYDDARKHAKQMKIVTASRYMPPWLPVEGHAEFVGARRLSADEIAVFREWHEAEMPEGDPADLPTRPRFASGWQLGEPDLVLEMEQDYRLAAEGLDVIRNFVIAAPNDEPLWVEAVELRPGNKRVVHHAVLRVDRSRLSRQLDRADAEPGFAGMAMGNAEDPDGHILVWTPGATPQPGQPGMAWHLDPGDDLVLQLHMIPVGSARPVRARIGLHLAAAPPAVETFAIMLRRDDIDIPPGSDDYAIEDALTLPVAVDALGIYPHAHYLGKSMQVRATLPGGGERWLLRIDDWDFNWQGMYRYREPIRLPAGTRISMRYTYDNSVRNVRNPNSPPQRVVAGNRSSDEMGNLALQVVAVNGEELTALREANWRAMLEDDPFDTGALFNLGVELARRGQHREAATFYERVLRIDPRDEGALVALAGTRVKLKQTDRAILGYEQVLRVNPRSVHARFLLGWLLTDDGRLEQAAEHLQRAVELDPSHAVARHRLGVVRERQGDPQAAIERYREALELDPDLAAARRDLERLGGRVPPAAGGAG